MDVDELCPGRESENQIIVSRMTYANVWSLVRFMKLLANESSLSREHENLATKGNSLIATFLSNCVFDSKKAEWKNCSTCLITRCCIFSLWAMRESSL